VSVSFVARPSWDRREVAYAIDRKVGTAVQRNLLRRRLRAIVAERADQLPTGAYLVRSGPEGTGFEFLELKVAMSRAMQKATKRVPEGVGQDRRASVGAGR
jgi:ribonuclease P protein component